MSPKYYKRNLPLVSNHLNLKHYNRGEICVIVEEIFWYILFSPIGVFFALTMVSLILVLLFACSYCSSGRFFSPKYHSHLKMKNNNDAIFHLHFVLSLSFLTCYGVFFSDYSELSL